jgi:hypothetical protein
MSFLEGGSFDSAIPDAVREIETNPDLSPENAS